MEKQTPKWLDTRQYPFRQNYLSVDGHKLHYLDEGKGETILLVHGTPSWSFEYRYLISKLSENYRCIAPDHMGFGLSDKPHDYGYSTQKHSQNLEKLIDHLGLKNIILVVHDFGGPIGLHMAIKFPEKISRIIIFNTWMWSSQDDPEFKKISKILRSPVLPFLYRQLNFSAKFLLPKSFGDKKLDNHTLKHYTRPFSSRREREGPLAFARSLLHDQGWFESLWQQREAISHLPVLLIWGMKDPAIKPHKLEKFKSGFPNSTVVTLESCGHFPQEEEPQKVLEAVMDFLKK